MESRASSEQLAKQPIEVIEREVVVVEEVKVKIGKFKWITTDDPFAKRLVINVKSVPVIPGKDFKVIVISGDEYESLGQWSDEKMEVYILEKLGLAKA